MIRTSSQCLKPCGKPILRGFILPFRSWRSATFYKHEWTQAGSPLIAYTQVTRDRLRERLPDWDVQMAMNYGGEYPIGETLQTMAARGDAPIVVIPLFPEYTQSTTKTILIRSRLPGVKTVVIDRFMIIQTIKRFLRNRSTMLMKRGRMIP